LRERRSEQQGLDGPARPLQRGGEEGDKVQVPLDQWGDDLDRDPGSGERLRSQARGRESPGMSGECVGGGAPRGQAYARDRESRPGEFPGARR
jgi:hypothetical protein